MEWPAHLPLVGGGDVSKYQMKAYKSIVYEKYKNVDKST